MGSRMDGSRRRIQLVGGKQDDFPVLQPTSDKQLKLNLIFNRVRDSRSCCSRIPFMASCAAFITGSSQWNNDKHTEYFSSLSPDVLRIQEVSWLIRGSLHSVPENAEKCIAEKGGGNILLVAFFLQAEAFLPRE